MIQLNKGESRHSLARATYFGQKGEVRQRYREGQEEQLGALGLVVNAMVLDNTVEISNALNTLAKEGMVPTIDELAALSPYQTRHIKRFGNYGLDLSAIPAPVTDDLTFAIEPPEGSDVIEADQEAHQETDQR